MADPNRLIGADGKPIDASLEGHVRDVEGRRFDAHAKAASDPRAAALNARLTVEDIARQLHLREIAPTNDRELDAILKRLEARGVIPIKVRLHFRTVQRISNFWVHLQSGVGEPTARDLEPLLPALDLAVEWYFTEHLKLNLSRVRPQAPQVANPPVAADVTPATIASMVGGMGTRWLDGELIPIWRGPQPSDAGCLQVMVDEGDVTRPQELRIDATRPRFIGRTRLRADGCTPNDLRISDHRVSQDQAAIEVIDRRVVLRNTSSRSNVAVGLSIALAPQWVPPGASRPLHHRVPVRFGNASGVFLDSRLYETAPESAVDPATGLLARQGLACEVALTLAGRRQKIAFFARYSPDDEISACCAAQLLHGREPRFPAARVRNVAVLLCDATEGMEGRLEALHAAGLAPSVAGSLPLRGESVQADARLEAALGALTRLAAAGGGARHVVDLERYAIPSLSLPALVEQAPAAYLAGGGVVVFWLDEVDRLRELGHPAHAAVELEFREMLVAAIGPADRITHLAEGVLAVLTHTSADRLAREQAAAWHARGPVQVGVLELDRCVRGFLVPRESLAELLAEGASFVREATSGVETRGLPTPIAHHVELAGRAGDPGVRLAAVVNALEFCWKLVACVLIAVHRRQYAGKQLAVQNVSGWAQPWIALATGAAAQLLGGDHRLPDDHRLVELVRAVDGLATQGGLVGTAAATASAIASLRSPAAPREDLDRVFDEAYAALRSTLGALRALRGWALVAVREAEPLDHEGKSLRVHYTDFTGPDATGAAQQISVNGLPVHTFVYLARWAEGIMVVLDPWIRRARNPRTGGDELFFIEAWPTAPGRHTYRAVTGLADVQLDVTARQLGR